MSRMIPLARSYSTSAMRNTFWPITPAAPAGRSLPATTKATLGNVISKIVKASTWVTYAGAVPPMPLTYGIAGLDFRFNLNAAAAAGLSMLVNAPLSGMKSASVPLILACTVGVRPAMVTGSSARRPIEQVAALRQRRDHRCRREEQHERAARGAPR